MQIHVVHPIVKFNVISLKLKHLSLFCKINILITRDSPDDEFEVLLQYALDTVGFRNNWLT